MRNVNEQIICNYLTECNDGLILPLTINILKWLEYIICYYIICYYIIRYYATRFTKLNTQYTHYNNIRM